MSAHPSISVRTMADRLGVSVATVSRALNNHPEVAPGTRARVLEMADRVGYIPRVGQRAGTVIGLIYPHDPLKTELGSFESAILSGIMDGVTELAFDIAIINVERDRAPTETYTQFFRRKGIRGVIIRNTDPNATFADEIAEEGFPAVVVADRSDHAAVNYIYTDSHAQSVRAVEHLVHLGHRRIGLAVHHVMDSDHRDRRDGYLEGLRRNNLKHDPALVILAPASMETGAAIISRLFALPDPPTAVYIADPLTTVGAMHECLRRGIRIPQDLSIVGFDDSDVRYMTYPTCTAVVQDAARLGREAARWLTRAIAGLVNDHLRESLPGGFSLNQSTGVCPAAPRDHLTRRPTS